MSRKFVGFRIMKDDVQQTITGFCQEDSDNHRATCLQRAIDWLADETGISGEAIAETLRGSGAKNQMIVDADGTEWRIVEVTSDPNDYGTNNPIKGKPSLQTMGMLRDMVEAEGIVVEDLLGFVVAVDQIEEHLNDGGVIGDGTDVICVDHDIGSAIGQSVLDAAVEWAPAIVASMGDQ